MARTKWTDEDQAVALYLAKLGRSDSPIEEGFLATSGHTRRSLKMAIANFRFLLGFKGLKNVSVRQKNIFAELGALTSQQLRERILSTLKVSRGEDTATASSSSGRRLSGSELEKARQILALTRRELERAAAGDQSLLWALRRKVYKELVYDERSKPMARRILKLKLFARQRGLCAICKEELPERYSVLDRIEAMKGYNPDNCRLLCARCDQRAQQERKYS